MIKYGLLKICKHCGSQFESRPRFLEFCSQKCKNPLNRGEYLPWNKGIKLNEEQKSKINMDGLAKGRGWNKGLENKQQAEKWSGPNNPNWEGRLNNQRPKKEINDEFISYKQECKRATYRTWYAMKQKGLLPANTGKRKNQYQLDHIIPFRQGYELGIDPNIIGGKSNLRWILGEENRTKWDRFQPDETINKVLGEYNGLLR